MPKAAPKPAEKPADKPAKPIDKNALLDEAAELVRSMRRQAQEAMDSAVAGWMARYHEAKKQGA